MNTNELDYLNFGLDPEVFAVADSEAGEVVVSPALLETSGQITPVIEDPDLKHPIYINRPEYSWMMDGVAFELTCKRILKSAKECYNILSDATSELVDFFTKLRYQDREIRLYKKPVVNILPDWYLPFLNTDPKIFQGFIFGCDPDKDAIDTGYKCTTIDVATHLFRYGGGHFHISGHEYFKLAPLPAIKLLAIYMGNFAISNSPYPDQERQRATTYGRPGRYRQQFYKDGNVGVEYRTPSNSWISYPLEKMEQFFEQAKKAAYMLINPERGKEIVNEFLAPTIDAIVSCNQTLATDILNNIG